MATTEKRRNVALKEAMTKPQLLDALSESTGLQRKDVAAVLDELGVVIERHVKRRAVGTFTLPGLLKIKAVRKPATKARKMISPFTGQEITVAAKPASRAVKVQPLSRLKRVTEWAGPAEGERGCAVQTGGAMVPARRYSRVRGPAPAVAGTPRW